MCPWKKTILKNGLRILTIPRKDDLATTFLVLVEAGSKYEEKNISGLSHFLEHMCFKGTEKRPKAIDIAGELDGLGAESNAFTTQEYTGYFAKVEAHKLDQALDIVADLYLNPVFDATEIEKEKGVVIEELNMYEDLPMRKINDVFMELLYGDQPAGWDIGGTKEVVRSLTKEQIVAYRKAHYVPQSTVVVVAGSFDEAAVIGKIEAAFGAIPEGSKAGKCAVSETQEAPRMIFKKKNIDQAHIMLGCRAFSAFDTRRFALEVLADILGGGMSSRLFQRVREEMGAAYSVRAGADLFTDHGFLAVNAGIDRTKLAPVVSAIVEEMGVLRDALVPEAELQRAKSRLVGRIILGLEASDELGTFYGVQEVVGEPLMSPEELVVALNGVTAEDVRAVAREIFTNNRLNLAIIAPEVDESALNGALRFA
jgi:predicted Zn-dependent peptidase